MYLFSESKPVSVRYDPNFFCLGGGGGQQQVSLYLVFILYLFSKSKPVSVRYDPNFFCLGGGGGQQQVSRYSVLSTCWVNQSLYQSGMIQISSAWGEGGQQQVSLYSVLLYLLSKSKPVSVRYDPNFCLNVLYGWSAKLPKEHFFIAGSSLNPGQIFSFGVPKS